MHNAYKLQIRFNIMVKHSLDMPFTNISVNVKTLERLKKNMKYGDSMNSFLNKLLDEHERKK